MPINESMMRNFKKQYGSKKGRSIYFALENKMKSKVKGAKGSAKATLKHKLRKMYS